MKAVVYERYGPPEVLRHTELHKPEPRPGEVLIAVRATTVTAGDCRMRRADPFMVRFFNGLFRPRRIPVLGFEIAGVVEAVGEGVGSFRPGDEVCAFNGFGFGGYAEFRRLPASGPLKTGVVALKPRNLDFGEAAAVPTGGITAVGFLRAAEPLAGRRILIYGASGSVGTYAVQLAKHQGAEVTGVCSTRNLELVRSLGADHVIDYTAEDFTRNEKNYDLIVSCNGVHSIFEYRRCLKPGGTFVAAGGGLGPVFGSMILG
ncbi:MAG: zinc-binding dehydrogenase, partial [Candidatus Coatesbacteria bacterium]|nr:zinc-binding dehydrogenase [Candidatus Coatesbacteria bacterium]